VSANQINLTWATATDDVAVTAYNVERCQGAGCTAFAQIGTATTVTYSDTGLLSGTSYSYRVRAIDAAGNSGPYSPTATATTLVPLPDTQPPTAPASATATAVSSSRIDLTWTAATDNIAVTLYSIERCQDTGCTSFIEVGTTTAPSFSNTGLTAATSYSYRVRATDAAGNAGPYSPTATATTPSGAPVPIVYVQSNFAVPQTPQSVVPVSFTAAQSAGSLNVVAIGWSSTTAQVTSVVDSRGNVYAPALAPTTQTGARSHVIYYAANVAAAPTNTVTVTFSTAVAYPDVRIAEYRGIATVSPVEAAGGASGTGNTSDSGPITVTTSGLNVLLVGANDVGTVTTAAGAGYTSRVITSPNGSILEDRTVTTAGSYSATAALTSGGWVMQLVAFRGATTTPDTQPPTAPASATTTVISSSRIDVAWTGATDNVGVTSYRVERCQGASCATFTEIGTAATLSYSNTGLSPSTSYSYRVRATDSAGNLGPYSPTASATTPSGTSVPSPPTNLSAAPFDDVRIDLSWTASPSTIAAYLIERCQGAGCSSFVQIASVQSTTFSDTGLQPSTTYRYRVRAIDAGNNFSTYSGVASATTLVASPAYAGQWSAVRTWPNVAIHAALMPNGKVLSYDIETTGQGVEVWDPATNMFSAVPYPGGDLFCSGLVLLPDGRTLVVGGHISNYVGLKGATLFNSSSQTWSNTGSMTYGRWYPTATVLPNGRVIVLSGAMNGQNNNADIPELFDPATGIWTQLNNAALSLPLYPHAFVLPNGNLLVTGSYEEKVVTRSLNVSSQTWTTIDPVAVDGGSAVMYLPGKVLTSGMGTAGGADITGIPSASTSYVLDMTAPVPTWRQTPSMAFQRDYHTLTVLPDGSVLATGGGTTTGATDASTAVLAAELWSPLTETWRTMASMQTPRLYHSTALLLPDARVLVAGGGRNAGVGAPPQSVDRFSSEIYSPPYLFNGSRPVITSAPTNLQYATGFAVTLGSGSVGIGKVSLIRLGSVTHAINMNQRFVPLTFTQAGNTLTVQAPANANIAPPGHYMLFVVDSNGVPSVAPIVKIQ